MELHKIFPVGEGLFFTYLNNTFFHFQMGLGECTNNFAELLSLKLLLQFAIEKGCIHLHIFGDSLIIINWVNKVQQCRTFALNTLFEEVNRLWTSFDHISCHHVYREWNTVADRLSKAGVVMDFGTWKFFEHKDVEVYEFYHRPFAEAPTYKSKCMN